MFKKFIQSFTKSRSTEAEQPAPSTKPAPAQVPAKAAAQGRPADTKPAAKAEPAAPAKPPEELCGITAGMNKEQIKERLAFLYRRYNSATSSLDAKLRKEAELMLDAIVTVREKVFGAI